VCWASRWVSWRYRRTTCGIDFPYDALGNATPVDRVQSGGNWKSPTMVLKYARRTGIANEGVIITE
jgi:hypothetical protein